MIFLFIRISGGVIIFRTCFKSITQLSGFNTKYYLIFYQQGITSLKLICLITICVFCHKFPETILHLFCEYLVVQDFWHKISLWILRRTGIHIEFTNDVKISVLQNRWKLLANKFHHFNNQKIIFQCSRKEIDLNVFFLQEEVSRVFSEQKMLSQINSNENIFVKKWEQWKGFVAS